MDTGDAEDVLRIYQEGIDTGHATLNPVAPDWADWDRGHLAHSRTVAVIGGAVTGWAALAPVSHRAVYRGVAEISIYVGASTRRLGIGWRVMSATVEASERAGLWTLQAGIFPENRKSIALHEAFGFVTVGTRQRIGRMAYGPFAGRWRDVVLMERRSTIVGTG
jgi:phosphinothricin acetyltransferase